MFEVSIWIGIIVLVVLVDIATSDFLFSFLGIGAVVAAILSFFGVALIGQIIAFLVVGIIAIAIGYPWAKKKFKGQIEKLPLMEEKYIGKVMTAESNIIEKSNIKVEGIYWTAINKGVEIKKDDKFKIVAIEGTKLVIEKEEDK